MAVTPWPLGRKPNARKAHVRWASSSASSTTNRKKNSALEKSKWLSKMLSWMVAHSIQRLARSSCPTWVMCQRMSAIITFRTTWAVSLKHARRTSRPSERRTLGFPTWTICERSRKANPDLLRTVMTTVKYLWVISKHKCDSIKQLCGWVRVQLFILINYKERFEK